MILVYKYIKSNLKYKDRTFVDKYDPNKKDPSGNMYEEKISFDESKAKGFWYDRNTGLGEIALFGDDTIYSPDGRMTSSMSRLANGGNQYFYSSPLAYSVNPPVFDKRITELMDLVTKLKLINDSSLASTITKHISNAVKKGSEKVKEMYGEMDKETSSGNSADSTSTTMEKILDTLFSIVTGVGNALNEIGEKQQLKNSINDHIASMGIQNIGVTLYNRQVLNPLHQYTDVVDVRSNITTPNLGRVYFETFHSHQPVVFIRPGIPEFISLGTFLSGSSESRLRQAILKGLTDNSGSIDQENALDEMVAAIQSIAATKSNPTRYYDFKPDIGIVKTYAKTLLREIYLKMGLGDAYGKSGENVSAFESFKKMFKVGMDGDFIDQWFMGYIENSTSTGIKKYEWIPFRVDRQGSSADDSFSNTTSQSMLASKLKEPADNIKEFRYISQGQFSIKDATNLVGISGTAVTGMANMIQTAASAFAGAIGGNTVSTVIDTGGNLLMPEIWKDSSMDRSISLKIKLRSVYGNPLSIFEDIYMPAIFLLSMALPRQVDSAVYISPALVQAFSKGWFACDLGMITSITITRGADKDGWTDGLLPRELDITLNIKDLMPTMMLSIAARNKFGIFYENNTGLKQYINILSGFDIWDEKDSSAIFRRKLESIAYSLGKVLNWKHHLTNILTGNNILGLTYRGAIRVGTFFGGVDSSRNR